MRWLLVLAAVACGSDKPRPLPEAIIGAWDELCSTDREETSSCAGATETPLVKTFKPDGTIESAVPGRGDQPLTGTWKLHGNELELEFRAGETTVDERYRARIAGGLLVLWYDSGKFGRIYNRHGTTVTTTSLATTKSGATTGAIDGVRYTIELPAGYQLTRDDNHEQRWTPPEPGFEVHLGIEPRAHTLVDGKPLAEPCPGGAPGIGGSSRTIDGVERKVEVSVDHCVDPERTMMCSVGHTRGYLESAELDVAAELCRHLTFVR